MACDINGSTVKLYVDGILVPLNNGWEVAGYIQLSPLDPQYVIEVDGKVGRQFAVRVATSFPLKGPTPGRPCGAHGVTQNFFEHVMDLPEKYCQLSNPAVMRVKPGPDRNVSNGMVYEGVRADMGECPRFTVSVPIARVTEINNCPVVCKESVIKLQAGPIHYLVTDTGAQYPMVGDVRVDCVKGSSFNKFAATAIRKAILEATSECDNPGVIVNVAPNKTSPKCVTVTIRQSPIKVTSIRVGTVFYQADITKC
jgi:hypothetical protein